MIELAELKTKDKITLNGLLFKSNNNEDRDINKNNNKKNNNENKEKEIVISVHGIGSNMFKKRNEVLARRLNEIGIDMLVFNNRGAALVDHTKTEDGKEKVIGSTYEVLDEAIYDIESAVNYCKSLGYKKIHLLGHSLGCIKLIMYMQSIKKDDDIVSLGFLSLVDFRFFTNKVSKEELENAIEYANSEIKEGRYSSLMPDGTFMIPISVATFLRYFKRDNNIDFANYEDESFEFKELNSIDLPKFFVYGNNGELITKDANDVKKILEKKINSEKTVAVINGANHSYTGYEEELAEKYIEFLRK